MPRRTQPAAGAARLAIRPALPARLRPEGAITTTFLVVDRRVAGSAVAVDRHRRGNGGTWRDGGHRRLASTTDGNGPLGLPGERLPATGWNGGSLGAYRLRSPLPDAVR